jgi:site-specific DNA-methyltransferase (adenine-specific)
MVTPYYADESVTIYHADFRDVVGALPVDLIVADPPYGQTSLDWDRWVGLWPAYVPSSSMWVFGTLRMFMDHAEDFHSSVWGWQPWRMSQDIVWEKHNGSSFHADRFKRVHESVAHFYRGNWSDIYRSPQFTADATARTVRRKTRPPHTGHIENAAYTSTDGGPRLMRSVIQVHSAHGYAENETQKPVGILTPLIEYGCPPGGLVLDPFMGSGSTLIAARDSGRRAIGIDIREDQCEIAARRCQWLVSA